MLGWLFAGTCRAGPSRRQPAPVLVCASTGCPVESVPRTHDGGGVIRQLVGDCRVQLATLEPESIQSVITSPPYMGLRDYGTDPLVWGGDPEHAHEWGGLVVREFGRPQGQTGDRASRTYTSHGVATERFCSCGAWLGSLGLEPTPELYIEHLVEVFRGVRRVLRPDGVLWVNLGDSYAGSGKGPTGWNGMQNAERRQGFAGGPDLRAKRSERPREGLKPKDLMMMPARVAMALQADGWYLRSMIPWLKRNSMPESVLDRPATAVEYVFLLSKSRTYYWDADAVRVAQGNNTHSRGSGHTPKEVPMGQGIKANSSFHAATNGVVVPGGRARRNTDWFVESWQGLMLDEHDDPLALVVNPQPLKLAHFASFPVNLVEPMVKASTRPGDTVLDPFSGAGTVSLVADRLGRNAIGIDLKSEYCAMAADRLTGDAPLFVQISEGVA